MDSARQPLHPELREFVRQLEATHASPAALTRLAKSLVTAPDRGLLVQLIAFARKMRSLAPELVKELAAVIAVGTLALRDAESRAEKSAASLRSPSAKRLQLPKPPARKKTKR